VGSYFGFLVSLVLQIKKSQNTGRTLLLGEFFLKLPKIARAIFI
jgi:hypothetical protein